VVADQFVELDQASALLEPGGEALVELGPGGFRQRLVGSVSNQQVAEAEAVLARQQRPVRPDQLLPHQRGQAWSDLALGGGERLDGAAVKDLALDRASLEHAPLGRLELVQTCGEERLQGGRDDDLAVRLTGHRHHLVNEERVASSGARNSFAQLAREPLRDQLVDRVVREWLQP
jgi:hypothetical protein